MSMASTTPWQFTIGRLTIQWAAAARLAGLDQRPVGTEAPLEAPPHCVAARTTPPTQGADWRARVYVWMSELGG